MDELQKAIINFFDLEETKKEVQERFLEDIGEVMMNSILQKAWAEFDGNKKKALMQLLEESTKRPDDVQKREAVLEYLDDNMVNLYGFIEKELEGLQTTYREYRDELRDTVT